LLPQSALTLNDDGTLGVRVIDDADVVAFIPVRLIRDTPQGVWVMGPPATSNVIVLGQEYVTAGVTVAPTYREVTQ
jgi:multidrug efflux system membrane fusion protein